MDNASSLIDEIDEIKESIVNDYLSPEQAINRLSAIENRINTVSQKITEEKVNALKSLMIIFNITNFSDMSILFSINNSDFLIIEESGDQMLCGKITEFIKDDPDFFKGIEKIEIGGEYYRLFSESMTTDDAVFTLISLSLSQNFRSTRFHILCDIVMDYVKSFRIKRRGMYTDLFDFTVIELTKFISLFEEHEPVVFFFRYEYISEFFNKIGLATIIQMSHHIKYKLIELFGNDASIIRLSLSSYVVVASHKDGGEDYGDMITKTRINFSFKGIVLPYTVIQVPYKKEHSIYDIFENVNLLNNYLRNGDIRI